ncbi:MAG: hypothetical protein J6J31_01520 [Thermoguttaceae bacterium]|nr:hypothetical protein [Thermoguttaceae bacterium]
MSEKQNSDSPLQRIFENLAVLERRNPDLKRLLSAFDGWLAHFVQDISETADGKTQPDPFHQIIRTAASTASGIGMFQTFSEPDVSPNTSGQPTDTAAGPSGIPGFSAADLAAGGASAANTSPGTPSLNTAASGTQQTAVSAFNMTGSSGISSTSGASVSRELRFQPSSSSSPQSVPASITAAAESGDLVPASAGHDFISQWKDEDIDQLEKRLLLKIEASRWALERDRLLKMSVDFQTQIEPRDHNLLMRARDLTNCYLWMNNPETAPVIASETYEMLADAYNAAAQCVGFMHSLITLVDSSPKSERLSSILRDALYTTATAQSALRRVTYEVSGREDQDQIRIHRWLTFLTKRYSIYVNKHMKKDSLAPKECIYKIPDCIVRLKDLVKNYTQRQKTQTESFSRIQYHAGRIQAQAGGDYDWKKIIETINDLADAGVSPDDLRFSDNLKHILCYLQDVPTYKEAPFFVAVLMEMDFWRKNAIQKAKIEQELTAQSIRPASDAPEEEYQSVWKEEIEDVLLPNTFGIVREKGGYRRGESAGHSEWKSPMFPKQAQQGFQETVSQHSTRSHSREFGLGILNESETDAENDRYGISASHAGGTGSSRSEHHVSSRFTAHQDIPSYGDFSWERHQPYAPQYPAGNRMESLEEMIRQIQNRIQEKKIVFIADESGVQLLQVLQSRLGDIFVFSDEKQVSSETKLAQLVHPGDVGLVMLRNGAVSNLTRTIENYCRRFDKPLLRLENMELQSVIHQITAVLTLWK